MQGMAPVMLKLMCPQSAYARQPGPSQLRKICGRLEELAQSPAKTQSHLITVVSHPLKTCQRLYCDGHLQLQKLRIYNNWVHCNFV